MSEYDISGARFRTTYNRAGVKFQRETPATLDEAGDTVLANVKDLVSKYDPDGSALKFIVIGDLHRSENGVDANNNGVDDRYSMRLVSRLCDDIDFDAVLCAGDLVSAYDNNVNYIQENMIDVVDDFDDLCPYTNVYGTIGNHDKRYSSNRTLNTNEWFYNLWNTIHENGRGANLHYVDETNFYIDFVKHKTRIIFINQYDDVDSNSSRTASSWAGSAGNSWKTTYVTDKWKEALPTTDKGQWLVGVVFHGAWGNSYALSSWTYNDLSDTLKEYVDNGGRGILGVLAGHNHVWAADSLSLISQSYPSIPVFGVNRAFGETSNIGTVNMYNIGVYIADTNTGLSHGIFCGSRTYDIPFCAYFGDAANNGLFHNGTASNDWSYNRHFCVYNGNHVRIDNNWKNNKLGYNFTNLPKTIAYISNDNVSGDTDSVLFSAEAGDVITTELIFSENTVSDGVSVNVFAPQIRSMCKGLVIKGAKYTQDYVVESDIDVTAVGLDYQNSGNILSGAVDFEINVYKNGIKLVRQ